MCNPGDSEMPYKLLIDYDISLKSPLTRLLKPNEVIRNEPAELTFSVTNLGEQLFPGGKIRNAHIRYGPDGRVTSTINIFDSECGVIAPAETVSLSSEEIIPLTEGLSWIVLSIEPNREEKAVEYYQSPEFVISGPEWMNVIYVVNRELLLLISLIDPETMGRVTPR